MADRKDTKEKIRKIYAVLPKLDDQQCGFKTCGEFARAVAEGRAPCYGCVSGGEEVATRVCEIMGAKVPQKAVAQFGPSLRLYRSGLSEGRGMGIDIARGRSRGQGGGRGRGPGRRRGHGGGIGRGFGQGRRGR
jgi:hypothetical protein